MKIYIGIMLMIILFYINRKRENFKEYNSLDIPPTGIIKQDSYEQQPVLEKIESLPTKKFVFQSDQYISPLTEQETRLMESYLKRHFPTFLKIARIKKEQQQQVKRYDIVFTIKDDKNEYNHVVMVKIIVKDGSIFFNTIEYGGMVLPNELPSKQEEENLFFINESSNKITFLDNQIKNELDAFEKKKIEILLRRGRKAS